MRRLISIILLSCLVLAGCKSSGTDSQYDEISREIERIKTEAYSQEQSLPGPGGNIKIEVNLLSTTLSQYEAIDVLWQYVDQAAAIAAQANVFAQSGLRIGVATRQFEAKLAAVQKKLKASERTTLFLLVADGTGGSINIGDEIAVPSFRYMGRSYSATGYQFRQAGKSLLVNARSLPTGQIEMVLIPVFSRFLNSGGDMELTELSTTVRAMPGETVVLSGSTGSNQDVATALFSRRYEKRETQTLMTVTASFY